MRDDRRRGEIRLFALREHADHLAELLRDGRTKYYRDARGRDAVSYEVRRVVEFLTDGGGSGEFPGEFKRANPRVPWKAIDRLHGEFVDGFIPGKRLVSDPESPGHQCHKLLERPTPGTVLSGSARVPEQLVAGNHQLAETIRGGYVQGGRPVGYQRFARKELRIARFEECCLFRGLRARIAIGPNSRPIRSVTSAVSRTPRSRDSCHKRAKCARLPGSGTW